MCQFENKIPVRCSGPRTGKDLGQAANSQQEITQADVSESLKVKISIGSRVDKTSREPGPNVVCFYVLQCFVTLFCYNRLHREVCPLFFWQLVTKQKTLHVFFCLFFWCVFFLGGERGRPV